MKSIITLYKNSFSGLSTNSWMLALIMLINRSGSMVLPFMSVYLKEDLNMTLKDTGVLMASFGIGSIAGSFLGGYLTDKIGQFKVQFYSLIISGFLFFGLLFMRDYYSFLISVFFLSTAMQSLSPANASSVSSYAKPENITRAFALNRMAINLGFAIGPTIGGILAIYSYKWLFIVDGVTCILAGTVFYLYFRNKEGNKPKEKTENKKRIVNPYKDYAFLGFILVVSLFAIAFFQLFTTLPLYYKDIIHLSEFEIGMLISMNGVIVFVFEMTIVYYFKDRKNLHHFVIAGVFLMSVSYFVLLVNQSVAILILSMVMISFAEIFAMPFMATITAHRSDENNRGRYMGLYTLAYSIAFVFATSIGTFIADYYNYESLWLTMGILSLIVAAGAIIIMFILNKSTVKKESGTD